MGDDDKVKIVKASNILQSKVGSGPLDARVVERCQKVMDNQDVDFAPMAAAYLDALSGAVQNARRQSCLEDVDVSTMVTPVMQLKANGSVFGYSLIGSLANIMLSFLEDIEGVDDDVIEIVDAHRKTLRVIVTNKMKGDGGENGIEMQKALKAVCERYFSAKGIKGS